MCARVNFGACSRAISGSAKIASKKNGGNLTLFLFFVVAKQNEWCLSHVASDEDIPCKKRLTAHYLALYHSA
jgi:hypothetical protein